MTRADFEAMGGKTVKSMTDEATRRWNSVMEKVAALALYADTDVGHWTWLVSHDRMTHTLRNTRTHRNFARVRLQIDELRLHIHVEAAADDA